MQAIVNSTYEHKLQCALNRVGNRGIYCDPVELAIFREALVKEQEIELAKISLKWNVLCNWGGQKDRHINLKSTKQFKELLIDKGFNIPKQRKSDKYGTDELTLLKIFAQSKDDALKSILRIREIDAVKDKFVDARLVNSEYFCVYSAAGTVSGRRSSKKHILGIGNNAQNWPKHNDLGKKYRKCFKARKDKIFFSVDQKLAEDWAVMSLSASNKGLAELRAGEDRHRNLASFMFQKPKDAISDWPERFLGKKSRHAFNYGMFKDTFSETLAKEGYPLTPSECQFLLEAVHRYDPTVKDTFHAYVRDCIEKTRTLITPLGRERVFYGFRPNDANNKLFNEAFSWIPQSTIADNTGLAIVHLDSVNDFVINDGHDSVLEEIPDSFDILKETMYRTIEAFDREIIFYNGIKIKIPVEGELGYCLGSMIKLKDLNENYLREVYDKLQEEKINKCASSMVVG